MTANHLLTVPMLRVEDMPGALAFYCERLGYRKASEYRADPEKANPAYAVIQRGGAGRGCI